MKFIRSFVLYLSLLAAVAAVCAVGVVSTLSQSTDKALSETRLLFKAASFTDGINWGRANTVDPTTGQAGVLLLASPPPLSTATPIMCFFTIPKGTPIGQGSKGEGVYVQEQGADLLAFNLHQIKPAVCGNGILSKDPKQSPVSINGYFIEKIKGSTEQIVPIHVADDIDLEGVISLANSYTESAWSQSQFALKGTKKHIKDTMKLLSDIMTVLAGIDGFTLLRVKQVGDFFREILKGDQLTAGDAIVLKQYLGASASFIEQQQTSKRIMTRKAVTKRTARRARKQRTLIETQTLAEQQQQQHQLTRAGDAAAARLQWASRIVNEVIPKVHHYSHITYLDERFPWNLDNKDPSDFSAAMKSGKPIKGSIEHKKAWKIVHHRPAAEGDQGEVVHMVNEPQFKLLSSVPSYKVLSMKAKKYKSLKKAFKAKYVTRLELGQLQEEATKAFAELKRKLDEGGETALILQNRLAVYTLLYYAGMVEPSVTFYHHPKHTRRHNLVNFLSALLTILKFAEPPLPEPESHLTLDYFATLADDLPKRRDKYKLYTTPKFDNLVQGGGFTAFVGDTMKKYINLKKALASEMIHSVAQGVFPRYFDLPEWAQFTTHGVDKLVQVAGKAAFSFIPNSEWFIFTEDGWFSTCPTGSGTVPTFSMQYKPKNPTPFTIDPPKELEKCFAKMCSPPEKCPLTGCTTVSGANEDEESGSCERKCCSGGGSSSGRPRSGTCADCARNKAMTGWTTPMTYLSELNPMEKHHQLTRRYVELVDHWFDEVWKNRNSK